MNKIIYIILSLCFFESIAQEIELGLPTGHTKAITSVDISPDGKHIITGSKDSTIKLWELETGKLIKDFKLTSKDTIIPPTIRQFVNDVSFSPNGKYFASALNDMTIRLFELNSLNQIEVFDQHTSYVKSIIFSPNNKYILSTCSDGKVRLFDINSKQLLKTFNDLDTNSTKIFSSDSKYILSQTKGMEVVAVNIKTGRYKVKIDSDYEVNSFHLSSDNNLILVAYKNKTVKLYNFNDGKYIRSFDGHKLDIKTAVISPDGNYVATGSKEGTRLYECTSGKELHFYKNLMVDSGPVTKIIFTPDSKNIITGGNYLELLMFSTTNYNDGEVVFSTYNKRLKKGILSSSGKYLLTISTGEIIKNLQLYNIYDRNNLKIYNVNSGEKFRTLKSRITPITSLKLWDKKTLISNSVYEDLPLVHNIDNGKVNPSKKMGKIYLSEKGLYSPNNEYLVGTNDTIIAFFDANHKLKWHFNRNEGHILSMVFSPDSNYFIYCPSYDFPQIIDVKSKKVIKTFENKIYLRGSAVFNPNGKSFVISDGSNKIYHYDIPNCNIINVFKADSEVQENTVSFNAKGDNLIVSTRNNEILIFDVVNDQLSLKIQNNLYSINSIVFNKKGDKVLISSDDSTCKVYDILNGKQLKVYEGVGDKVEKAFFSHNEKLIISNSSDGALNIHDTNSGSLLIRQYIFDRDPKKWVHLHPSGLFDASPEAMELMYWTKGLEVIEFNQLKDKYYVPGLWEKVMNKEYLGNANIKKDNIALYPEIELGEIENNKLPIYLTKREGGYGEVNIYLNGKEIIKDARPINFDETLNKQTIYVDIANYENQTINGENIYEVKVKNEQGDVTSRGAKAKVVETKNINPPSFYGLLIGVSDYVGDGIDLKYPVIDTDAMENALQLTTKNLFKETHIIKLATNVDQRPRKEVIEEAIEKIAKKAKPEDVFMVYMSGHGINWSDNNNISDFYFLTEDARFTNKEAYNNEALRNSTTISTNEWVELIKKIPANKTVMIIDACGSGQAVENLITKRDIDSDQIKAIDRMKDRTGMFVISGSAANQVSYEASKYGQGLLTYTLLKGMSGVALKENSKVDVSTLFNYAKDEVPRLAEDIGGIQEPLVLFPKSGSFDIGILNSDDQSKIVINEPKQVYVRSNLLNAYELEDNLELSVLLDKELNSLSTRGYEVIWVDANKYSNGCKITGTYKQEQTQITLNYKTKCRGKELKHKISAKTKEELVKKIIQNL